ncbi:SurA domain-containing protein [Oleidesulfovibrio alaskensis G20]|uniref:SurA domain-containing protein n=1 Tax=Oleidesulfovibrio alaskensis (strain ATCC BAA-1058 / DSM 17464 / G20) TaxID=207559 RepID=Q30ZR1_OLEA2|nr:SurA N-terminal domain-containing protein [Oleidesulfovibrio alaskensis]ABB38835.1 SurA domain-containing protein [Oleidesulfovibrio alaskensis G20]MBG0773135.1 SurA N-terminal domain-containing protein [Oleidesulfovibrio alaskensis]MBL3582710.1 SurA N-terminal domain-containing protein [Oleidesulfovibrio alaskensis]
MRRQIAAVVAACVIMAAAGCKDDVEQQGVVATVNGSPVYLQELEARYDLDHLSWSGAMVPSVDQLRKDYGSALAGLIVQRLVEQDLEKSGLDVTDEEVLKAEEEVRADYPPGEFEKVLVEDYIDLATWRYMLRQHLQREKFRSEILRPAISLSFEEAEDYYKAHLSDFYLPERINFLYISGPDRGTVEKARDLLTEGKDRAEVLGSFSQLSVRELKMREDRIHGTWKQLLAKLEDGQASPVLNGEAGYEAFIMLGLLPEKVLGPSQAYPIIERLLIEEKMQQVYAQWLEKRLESAEVKVSDLLLRPGEDETPVPELAPEPEEPAAPEAFNATGAS